MQQPDWEELERRVAHLEGLMGVERAPKPPLAVSPAPLQAEVNPSALLPIVGRALLGLAGAYLLRALSESGTVPATVGVGTGILYAFFWLSWAARTPAGNRLEAAIHSLTAVLVLCPLLWEATLYLHALSTWATGALVVAFVVFGLGVSWRRNLLAVATIVTLAGLATAASLLVATHDVVPFMMVMLAIAAAVEVSSCLEHWLSERWLTALAADLAVLLATWLVTAEHGLPETYAPIPYGWLLSAQVALLAIYLASTIVRTLLRGLTFTTFETLQCAAAFLIGVGGGLRLSGDAHVIALFALACAAACYVVSFVVLDHATGGGRNFYTYSSFGLLLVLTGSRILLAGAAASFVWAALALACVWAGSYYGRLTLRVHGGIYLLLGLAGSGALRAAGEWILGSVHWSGGDRIAASIGLLAAALCYALVARNRRAGDSMSTHVYSLAIAGIAAWLLAGTAAGALTATYHAAFGAANHSYCASLRTAILAGLSLAFAWAGARWNLIELSRLIYPAMILGAYRLTMIDMAQDRKPALFLSLLIYGGVLIALPRLTRGQPITRPSTP